MPPAPPLARADRRIAGISIRAGEHLGTGSQLSQRCAHPENRPAERIGATDPGKRDLGGTEIDKSAGQGP